MNEKYIKELYKLANKAYKKNEVPVSAIIVYKNKIIAKAFNKKNLKHNVLNHAEILCLIKAYKKLKNWNLSGCTMYVTLEPCSLCKLVIEESRIDRVFFILKQGNCNNKYKKTIYEQMYVSQEPMFKILMEDFFGKLRKK